MKQNIKKAKRHLTKLRELISRRKHPLSEMKEEKVLDTLHKTREELWDKKFAGSKSTHDYNFEIIVKDNARYNIIALANYGGPKGSGYYTEFCAYTDILTHTVYGCADHNIMK